MLRVSRAAGTAGGVSNFVRVSEGPGLGSHRQCRPVGTFNQVRTALYGLGERADKLQVSPSSHLEKTADESIPQALRSGRSWHYESGFLVNQFLGRFGHTPSWIVEVEGSSFRHPKSRGFLSGILYWFRAPKVVRRNERRLAFAWPLRWPPPDQDERRRLVALALTQAGQLGRALPEGCGVCGRIWEGGPSMVEDRARHMCPDCAGKIERMKDERPAGVLSTWLWCTVAGFCGMWLQLLLNWILGWSTAPLGLVAGWLMGTANAPNLERRPVLNFPLTLLLICVFQALALALMTATGFGFYQFWDLTRVFLWTITSPTPSLWAACAFGALGLALALFERRLRKA